VTLRALAAPILVSSALALAPAVAQAAEQDVVNDAAVATYMQIAAGFWGQTPHCTGPNGESIAPYAIFGVDPDPRVAAWAESPGCRIWLQRGQWPAPANEQQCDVIVHEWGHLLGYDHSPDPGNIMYGGAVPPVVPGCFVFSGPDEDVGPDEPVMPSREPARLHLKKKRKAVKRCTTVKRTRKARKSCAKKRAKRLRRRSRGRAGRR